MDNVLLMALAGIVVPPIVSFLQKEKWSAGIKTAIAIVVSCVITAGVLAVQGNFTSFNEFVAQASVTWASAMVIYHMYFDGTALDVKLKSIGPK